jgi:dGTP triphosphohydrolase
MHRLRDFMFERVYLADASREEHRRAHETIQRIVSHLVERGDSAEEIVEYVAGMTDRYALAYADELPR